MRFIIPIQRKIDEPVSSYVNYWSMQLIIFKRILKGRINKNKLLFRKQSLLNQPNIQWIITNNNYDIVSIVESYVNHLQCFYDGNNNNCYYTIPKTIRCPYTLTSLDTVVRTLEYGGTNMSPLCWLRPSFSEFVKSTKDK